jgi:hypothetical protein
VAFDPGCDPVTLLVGYAGLIAERHGAIDDPAGATRRSGQQD